MVSWWKRRNPKQSADEQEGDVHALDREGDPRDLVDRVAANDPAGAPQEGEFAEERRSAERT